MNEIEQRIKAKVEAIGTPLKDWDINIYRGVLTGYNEAFIIDGKKRLELIAEDPKSDEIIRPILRGRDIKRYGYDFADLWLINTHNGIKEKGVSPINIDDYPAIKNHLDNFYPQLAKRADKGNTPYNLRNCAYMEDFYRQKIIWIELTDSPNFSLDNKGKFINNTVFFISGERLPYIISFLNSKLCEWYFTQIAATSGAGTRRWIKMYIEQICIPKLVGHEIEIKINKLVNEIHELKSINLPLSEIESQIELEISRLVSLTEEEIDFINRSVLRKK